METRPLFRASVTYKPDVSDTCPWNIGLLVDGECVESLGAGSHAAAIKVADAWVMGRPWLEIVNATYYGTPYYRERNSEN